eukprot:1212801-Amphidinium_carterae.1
MASRVKVEAQSVDGSKAIEKDGLMRLVTAAPWIQLSHPCPNSSCFELNLSGRARLPNFCVLRSIKSQHPEGWSQGTCVYTDNLQGLPH